MFWNRQKFRLVTAISILLVAGFLVLSTSSFAMNADMGLLTAIGIALALVIDFLLLPPLLIYLDSWLSGETKKTPPVVTVAATTTH